MLTNEDAVREIAYAKWQAAGAPSGDGVEFWLEAEQEFNHQNQECTEEAIDEASEESFPASDPPARGSLTPAVGKQHQRRKR